MPPVELAFSTHQFYTKIYDTINKKINIADLNKQRVQLRS